MNIDFELKKISEKMQPGKDLIQSTVIKMDEFSRLKDKEETGRKHIVFEPTAVFLIMLIILSLSVSAYASGWFSDLIELFSGRFGKSEKQQEIIDDRTSSSGISVVHDGLCITAEGKLTEEKLLVIAFSVRREDGSRLVDENMGKIKKIVMGGASYEADQPLNWVTIQAGSNEEMNDFHNGMNEVQYFEYFLIPGAMPDYIHLTFNRPEALCENGEQISLSDTSVFQTWDFMIPLKKTEETQNYDIETAEGRIFEANGEMFELTRLYLSPMVLQAEYRVISDTPSHRVVYPSSDTEYYNETPFWENISLLLRLKNGTMIDMSAVTDATGTVNIMGSIEVNEEEDCFIIRMGGVLPEAIPLEEMDCVIFNGTEYFPEGQH